MVFTQFGILDRDSPDVEENRSPFARQRTKRIAPFRQGLDVWGRGWQRSTLFRPKHGFQKTVSCHLLSWQTLKVC